MTILYLTLCVVVMMVMVAASSAAEQDFDLSTALSADQHPSNAAGDTGATTDDVYNAFLTLHSNKVPFKNVVKLLHKAAKKGNAEAMLYLGLLHTYGIGVVRSEAKAVTYYTMSALSGCPEAAVVLTHRYENGIGVPRSVKKAVTFAKEAAEKVAKTYKIEHRQVPAEVLLELWDRDGKKKGSERFMGVSADKVLQSLVYQSEQGNMASKMTLGYTYLYGLHSQEVDVAKAVLHFEDALAKNHPAAYGALGQLYMQGVDDISAQLAADPEKAFRLFEQGQALGDPASLNGLGYFYARSASLLSAVSEQDKRFEKAGEYYTKSAELGNADATYNLAVLKLHGKGMPKEPEKAKTLLQIASGKGSLLANWQLGLLSIVGGAGMPQSDANALRFLKEVMHKGQWSRHLGEAFAAYVGGSHTLALVQYLLACEMDVPSARANALHILNGNGLEGVDVIRYREEGVAEASSELLSRGEALEELILTMTLRAALEGDRAALLRLGDHYFAKGNYSRSLACYQQSSAGAGLPQALFNLGYMCMYGLGTTGGRPDFSTAKRYLDMSLERSDQISNGDAFYAVKGALVALNFRYWLHYFSHREPAQGPSETDSLMRLAIRPFGVLWDDWLLGLSGGIALCLLVLRNQLADVVRR